MRQWTFKERLRQSVLIREWRPWTHATGAKTPQGKAASRVNSYKYGGHTAEVKKILKTLRVCEKITRDLAEK